MKHLRDAPEEFLRTARQSARTACPAGLQDLWKQIGEVAERALGERLPRQ